MPLTNRTSEVLAVFYFLIEVMVTYLCSIYEKLPNYLLFVHLYAYYTSIKDYSKKRKREIVIGWFPKEWYGCCYQKKKNLFWAGKANCTQVLHVNFFLICKWIYVIGSHIRIHLIKKKKNTFNQTKQKPRIIDKL